MHPGSDRVVGSAPDDETPKPTTSVKLLVGAPLALVATLLVTLLLFLPILHGTFIPIDDSANVLANPYINNPSSQNLGYFFLHPFYFVYMPLTFCLWGLCARIAPLAIPQERPLEHIVSSLNPAVFHAASLIIHVANVALVFAILRRFRFAPWACAAGSLIFALHPVQVEAVAWVTGANNLTAGFFGLLALYLYMLGLPANPGALDETPPRRSMYFALATVSFICALLSKPAAAVLPLLIVVIELWVYRRPWRQWITQFSVLCLLSLICAGISAVVTAGYSDTIWSPLWGRPFVAGDALAFYVIRLAAPLQTIDFARPPQLVLHQWWGYVDWLLPAGVFAVLWRWPLRRSLDRPRAAAVRETHWLRVAVLLFACGVVSTLGFVPFYTQWNSTVADRYVYLAMLGPAVMVASVTSKASIPSNFRLIGGCVLAIVLALLTALQVPVWRNPFSFVEYTVTTEPDAPATYELAGNVLYYRGDFEGALAQFTLAEKRRGTESELTNRMLGNTFVRLGRYDNAVKPLVNNVLGHPDDQDAWLQLWALLPHVHDSARLEAIMRQRLSQNPHDARAAFTLGAIFLYRGETSEALPYLAAGAAGSPEFGGMHYDYGVILEGMNRLPEAISQYETALSLDPQNKLVTAALTLLRRRIETPVNR